MHRRDGVLENLLTIRSHILALGLVAACCASGFASPVDPRLPRAPGALANHIDLKKKGLLYIADGLHGVVDLYDRNAYGTAMPIGSLGGPDSQIPRPCGIAEDRRGFTYVSNCGGPGISISVFPPGSVGDALPVFVFTSQELGSGAADIFTAGSHGRLYVIESLGSQKFAVYAFDRTEKGIVRLVGKVALPGTNFTPEVLAVDSMDRLLLSYAIVRSGKIEGWGLLTYASSNLRHPLSNLTVSPSDLPIADILAVDPRTNEAVLGGQPNGQGKVCRYAALSTGKALPEACSTPSPFLESLNSISVGPDGYTYALTGSGSLGGEGVVVLGRNLTSIVGTLTAIPYIPFGFTLGSDVSGSAGPP